MVIRSLFKCYLRHKDPNQRPYYIHESKYLEVGEAKPLLASLAHR